MKTPRIEEEFSREYGGQKFVYANEETMLDFIRKAHQAGRDEAVDNLQKIKITPAYVNLTTEWGQLDEDGIAIAVSRQALEETIKALDDTTKTLQDNK